MEKKCKDLVHDAFLSRMDDIRAMYNGKKTNSQGDELPPLKEYGLCIDFVPARTFPDQNEGYTRYQLSWGGPSEEFRVYTVLPCVEFWYMDWYDGACVKVTGKDANIIRDICGKQTL